MGYKGCIHLSAYRCSDGRRHSSDTGSSGTDTFGAVTLSNRQSVDTCNLTNAEYFLLDGTSRRADLSQRVELGKGPMSFPGSVEASNSINAWLISQ